MTKQNYIEPLVTTRKPTPEEWLANHEHLHNEDNMTYTDKQTIAQALHKLVALIHELELESEYTELLGVAQVLEEAQTALAILTKERRDEI